jgi:hypothetical protein
MGKRKIVKSNTAVAGVIEALLLVALVAIIISTIQLVYIPEIMRQREADHMDVVENQFSHLKSIIDLQSSIRGHDPISSSITLGSRELPYFVTARAFGLLHVIDDNTHVIITNSTGSEISINFNAIEFQSVNAYYINQNYILEGGGVVLSQDDGGEAMKIHPPVTFQNSSHKIYFNWTIYNFSYIGGKDSAEGYKSCYIRTKFASNEQRSYEDISHIKIYSNFVDAWNQSISWLKIENITITTDYDNSFINISTDESKLFSVNVEIVEIEVQIGVGTIMQYPKET